MCAVSDKYKRESAPQNEKKNMQVQSLLGEVHPPVVTRCKIKTNYWKQCIEGRQRRLVAIKNRDITQARWNLKYYR